MVSVLSRGTIGDLADETAHCFAVRRVSRSEKLESSPPKAPYVSLLIGGSSRENTGRLSDDVVRGCRRLGCSWI
jgi:hypothetical protein